MRCVLMGLVLGVLCAPVSLAQQPVLVAENGVAQATIVVAADAPPSVAYAAEELQRFLSEMGGVEIPKVNDAAAVATPNLIDVGNVTGRLAAPAAAFGIEDYHLATVGNALVIDGGKQRGVLYGAYGLLEDHLGCRWYTTEVSRIPKSTRLEIPALDERVKPILEYREPFVMDCYDGDWSARNRMNGTRATLEAKHGDKVRYVGFVHTFNELVPPEKYFAEHPEYFALVDGKRLGERTQLCCTNPDVINIITEGIRQRMRDNPDAMVFSISQNDWFNYCTCDKCAALAAQEESQIAPVLALVNHVAREVRGEFPDKAIDTLAYQWTRQPPKHMRPEPNVIVRFCSIECCFAHPFDQCEGKANKQFVKDAQGWKAVGARLWVWDYVTSFSHYLVPFPNLHVRKPNIQFFIDHGVTGIFEQDVYQTPHGEFSELSGYLNAKLLWNPKGDTDAIINEFLGAVYGPGAPYLRQYLDAIHEKVKGRNAHMGIWVGPEAKHLDDAVLAEADRLFDAAEAAAANDPAFLERIKIARLSPDYAIIERARNKQGTLYEVDHANFTVRVQPAFEARVKRFFEVAERCGFSDIREHMGALADYKAGFENMEPAKVLTPRDAVAVAQPKRGLHYAYYEGQFDALPDFDSLSPVREGVAGNIGLRPGIKADGIALKFTGYFHAPKDGVYTFALSSNDGSQLFLGDDLVVDNGGLHKLETKSGAVALRAGYHPLKLTYFESGGEEGLEVNIEGPDMGRRKISARLLAH